MPLRELGVLQRAVRTLEGDVNSVIIIEVIIIVLNHLLGSGFFGNMGLDI